MSIVLFLLRRLLSTALVLLAASVVVFSILHLVPGDPARAMVGPLGSEEAVAHIRTRLGLDKPIAEQYVRWLSHAIRGDLGESILLNQPVSTLLAERLPVTALLSGYALFLALLLSIPGSILSATRKGKPADYAARFVALIGVAMPSFWIGLMLILFFGLYLRVLPVLGYVSPEVSLVDHVRHMVLPAIALGAGYAALIFEMNRSSLIEVLEQDYIRTARAAGIPERIVVSKYAMRNALIPTVTVIGIQIGFLISSGVLVESVFAIPGLGRLLINAVLSRDYPLIQGCMLVVVFAFLVVNLTVDALYAVIDPRTRRREE